MSHPTNNKCREKQPALETETDVGFHVRMFQFPTKQRDRGSTRTGNMSLAASFCRITAIFAVATGLILQSSWVRTLLIVNVPPFTTALKTSFDEVRNTSRSVVTTTRIASQLPMFEVSGLLSANEARWIVESYKSSMYSCGGRAAKGCMEVQVLFRRAAHELLASIEKRVYALIDGLCINSPCVSEGPMNWQIVEYSQGGHFQRHVDGPLPLTFMAYLSDTEDTQGGSTHFPNVDPAV